MWGLRGRDFSTKTRPISSGKMLVSGRVTVYPKNPDPFVIVGLYTGP